MSITVRAKVLGYYGAALRRPGDVFTIRSPSDLGPWMVPLDTPPKADAKADEGPAGAEANGKASTPPKADAKTPKK